LRDSTAEGFAAAVLPLFTPFFAGGALAPCFTASALASFAEADLSPDAPFFTRGALPLIDDSEDAAATADLGASSFGFHAAAVALRVV
jgi:hypothetical protein